MKEKLIEQLNKLVEGGAKKSAIENGIGLPANSLSAVLAGHKEMPDKWISKIEKYLTPPAPDKKQVPEKAILVAEGDK